MAKVLVCETQFYLSIEELSVSLGVTEEIIHEIVEEGIITVIHNDYKEWLFDEEALRRIRLVLRLQRDLGVNLPGAALVVELLNEIDRLQKRT